MAFNDAFRKIPAAIVRRPSKFKVQNMRPPYGNLYVIREHVNDLFREERVEMDRYHALVTRPYAERLLQLAIVNGYNEPYTNQMLNWWMAERDLLHKIFKVYVPRFEDAYLDGRLYAFTAMFNLPKRYEGHAKGRRQWVERWKLHDEAVLELKGNPYPPVLSFPADHRHSLVKVLLSAARHKNTSAEPKTDKIDDSTLSEPEAAPS